MTPSPTCCGRRGSASARWGRSARSPSAASPRSSCRCLEAGAPRGGRCDAFAERAEAIDHFELFTFPYPDSALVLESDRTECAPRPRGNGSATYAQRHRARELGARRTLGDRQGAAGGDPESLEARRPARVGRQSDRSQLPGLRQRAPGPVHRDGVRDAARARPPRPPAGCSSGSREQPLPGLLPDRDAGRRRRRRPAQPRPRARHDATSRSTSTGGCEWRPYFEAVEAIMDSYGGRPALGQAPLPDRGDAAARYPRWDDFAAAA